MNILRITINWTILHLNFFRSIQYFLLEKSNFTILITNWFYQTPNNNTFLNCLSNLSYSKIFYLKLSSSVNMKVWNARTIKKTPNNWMLLQRENSSKHFLAVLLLLCQFIEFGKLFLFRKLRLASLLNF